jgi:flagellar biosynthetic protein FlhB
MALKLLLPLLLPVGALFAISLVASAAGPALLGSLGFRSGGFAFKANRLNPLSGLKRMFSATGLTELMKSIAKALLIGSMGYWLLATHVRTLLGLGEMDSSASAAAAGRLFNSSLAVLASSLLLIALIDVPVQIFQRNRRLKMSKDEVREDLKQTEGSPELKRAIRRRQQEVLSSSARSAVREATVVLTNPTHFAIALRYDPAKDGAPLVVARGRGDTAQAIKALAQESRVPMLEYPQLTRAIYYTTRAGQVIAEDLYVAVATLLAFVFRLDQSLAESIDQPSVMVPQNMRFDENGRPLGA